MKIGLFSANAVGSEVARFFAESGQPPACLVLDARGDAALNAEIADNSGAAGGNIFYSDSLSRAETLAAIARLNLDLIILAWWPYIIRPEVIALARLGCLNFHPSYLPYNRGKHYNFWALVEGAPFGVTLHWVDEGIDSGDIAFQARIPTTWEDTGGTLYAKAQREIVRLFKERFAEISSGRIPRVPQEAGAGSFHRAAELDAASEIKLDESYTARRLLDLLRARTFPPHPGAWFVDGGERYEVRVEIRKVADVEKS